MYDLQSYGDTAKSISSPESADGRELSGSQKFPIAILFGRALAPANLSARQAKEWGFLTSGIYGQPHTTSSHSLNLSELLESRLRQSLLSRGSTLFSLTWKPRVTPSGRRISALRASARRTSGNDCTGVPTPSAQEFEIADADRMMERREELKAKGYNGNGFGLTLGMMAVALASVPTPRTPTGGAESTQRKQELGRTESGGGDLQAIALLSSVTMESSRDWKDSAGMEVTAENPDGSQRNRLDQLPRQAQLAVSGAMQTGGTGETKSSGQLNPAYSRWLMGFPKEWDDCAVTATPLFRKSRRNS